jgi:ABC-2 type transport system permease protein
MRILDLAMNDLRLIVRDWKAALFLFIMPIAFTLVFGFAFSGAGAEQDARLPLGYLDRDAGSLSPALRQLLDQSAIIRLVDEPDDEQALREQVQESELAALLIVPTGYSDSLMDGSPAALGVLSGEVNSGQTIQNEIEAVSRRLAGSVITAQVSEEVAVEQAIFSREGERQAYFDAVLTDAIAAWENPPVQIESRQAGAPMAQQVYSVNSFAHPSAGMMAQFAIAGLMGAATIVVVERKTRCLQRLITIDISRPQILIGHFLAMFVMILVQLGLLSLFGHLVLKVPYYNQPVATLVMLMATALFCASMGLLIGIFAHSEEQVLVFSLIPMFVLAALGGAWVPLDFVPQTVRQIASLTPLAWVVGGFKDITVRGQGLEAVLVEAGVLLLYAASFIGLAAWRFSRRSG